MQGSFDLLIVGLTDRHPERSEGTLSDRHPERSEGTSFNILNFCRGLYVLFCLLSFVFLSCGWAFFKISFSFELALQALLKALV
jgi:hypothetical protein